MKLSSAVALLSLSGSAFLACADDSFRLGRKADDPGIDPAGSGRGPGDDDPVPGGGASGVSNVGGFAAAPEGDADALVALAAAPAARVTQTLAGMLATVMPARPATGARTRWMHRTRPMARTPASRPLARRGERTAASFRTAAAKHSIAARACRPTPAESPARPTSAAFSETRSRSGRPASVRCRRRITGAGYLTMRQITAVAPGSRSAARTGRKTRRASTGGRSPR
jgi:hypothetical protein